MQTVTVPTGPEGPDGPDGADGSVHDDGSPVAVGAPGRPALVPPDRRPTWQRWLRANLFATRFDAVISVLMGALAAWATFRLLRFTVVSADWEVVRRNLRLFMVGRFPDDHLARLWCATYLATAGAGVVAGLAARATRDAAAERGEPLPRPTVRTALGRWWPLASLLLAFVALSGTLLARLLALAVAGVLLAARTAAARVAGRSRAATAAAAAVLLVAAPASLSVGGGPSWDTWGGLLLTVFVTVVGVGMAFPLGIGLALARRSRLPVVRVLATAYIEVLRGVPLITLLLMGNFMLGFLFPTSIEPPSLLVRALIAIVAFEAAYLAEVVRGGLQSVPPGQVEAAAALGLRPRTALRCVVLPQALRAVIPAIVGQFISLFKDTSLLSIIAFLELINVASAVLSQPDFRGRGLDAVTYAFVGAIYWVGCYTMSRESRRLERRLGVGTR